MPKQDKGSMGGFASLIGSGSAAATAAQGEFDPHKFQAEMMTMGHNIGYAKAMASAIGNLLAEPKAGGANGQEQPSTLRDLTGALKDMHEITSGGGNGNGNGDGQIVGMLKVLRELGVPIGGAKGNGKPAEVGLAEVAQKREESQGNLAVQLLDKMGGKSGTSEAAALITALAEAGLIGNKGGGGGGDTVTTILLKHLLDQQQGSSQQNLASQLKELKELGLVNVGGAGGGLTFEQQMMMNEFQLRLAQITGEQKLQERQIAYQQSQHDNGTKAISDVIGFLRENQSNGGAAPGPEADGDAVKIHCSQENGGCGNDFIVPKNQLSDVVACTHCGTKWRMKN